MPDFASLYAAARDSADPVQWKVLADFADERGCPWYALAYRAKAVCLGVRFRYLRDWNKHWVWQSSTRRTLADWWHVRFTPESLAINGDWRFGDLQGYWWFTGDTERMGSDPWSATTHATSASGHVGPTYHADPPDFLRPSIDRFYAELLKRDGRVKTRPRFALA